MAFTFNGSARAMSANKDSKSGRVSFDDRGQPVWEWRVDTGTFSSDIDTQQLRQIQDEAAVTFNGEAATASAVGFDPYSTIVSAEPKRAPRRTLDDMRKLSEEIKRKRQQQQK
jgi:hypothetical protein